MQATCNGHTLIEGTIRESLQGAWLADVQLDHDEALTGAVTIAVGGVEWVGTVLRSGVDSGRSRAQIIGGAGGLSTALPGRAYTGTSLGSVLGHILDEAGETLSATSANIAGQFVPRWVRPAGTAGRSITAIASQLGLGWRVLRDGTIWIGTDTYPTEAVEHTEVDRDAISAAVLIAPTGDPTARPGITFGDDQVTRVITTVSGSGIRQKLSLTDDRLVRIINALVDAAVKRHLDTRALYPCTVLSQNVNLTLELMPDDAIMGGSRGGRGLSSIPIRHGSPGESVEVPSGTRVLLGFEAGDQSRPVATLWEADHLPTLRAIDADAIELGAADAVVVRAGDIITVGSASGTVIVTGTTNIGGPTKVKA